MHVASQTISLQELPVVGFVTHITIAAERGEGSRTGSIGQQFEATNSLVLVARTSTWLNIRRNHVTTYTLDRLAAYREGPSAGSIGRSDGANHNNECNGNGAKTSKHGRGDVGV